MVEETKQLAESAGVLGTLGVDWHLIAAQFVNFAVVLFVMWRWAYRPLVAKLDERGKRVAKGLDDAEAAAAARTSAETERDRIIDEARRSAKKLIEEAGAVGERDREETVRKARTEVEAVIAAGKTQLRTEKERMIADAKSETADLLLVALTHVIDERLDEKKDAALIKEALRKASMKV